MLGNKKMGRPTDNPKDIVLKVYKEISKRIVAIEQHFRNLLSPEEFQKLEELQGLRGQAEVIASAKLFEYAFSTGALMMMDIFDYRDND